MAVQSAVMQGSDLPQEIQSGEKCMAAGDTVLSWKTPNAVCVSYTLQDSKCTIEHSLHKLC